jgi:hypothetical protein
MRMNTIKVHGFPLSTAFRRLFEARIMPKNSATRTVKGRGARARIALQAPKTDCCKRGESADCFDRIPRPECCSMLLLLARRRPDFGSWHRQHAIVFRLRAAQLGASASDPTDGDG